MAGMDTEQKAPRVALVAGATRGAGRAIAVELARAGFYVYATGRSSRAAAGRSEIGRPETIEETGELLAAGAGRARHWSSTTRTRRPWLAWSGRSSPGTAASTSWSTTSSAATATRSGTGRCGSTA